MPLDPSIILGAGQGVTPLQNPMDIASKAMAMQNLAMTNQQQRQNFQDEQSMRQAYQNAVTVDPNTGNVGFDKDKMIQNLASGSNPSLAVKAQQGFMQMDLQRMQTQKQIADEGASMLNGIQNAPIEQREGLYQQAKNSQLGQMSQRSSSGPWPNNYDPTFVNSLQARALTVQQQADNQMKQQDLGIKQQEADTAALGEKNKEKELGIQTQEAFGSGGSGPAPTTDAKGNPIDPSTLVGRLPKVLQPKALEEIKDNQNIVHIAKPALAAFDRAASDARPLTGGIGTAPAAFIPNVPFLENSQTPGQKAFIGLVNTTIKETEASSRQSAFDSVKKNFMPQTGDSDAMIASKRASFIQYLKSHAAAPTNMKGGIDLSQYPATSIDKAIGGGTGSSYQPTPQEAAAELARRQQANQANR